MGKVRKKIAKRKPRPKAEWLSDAQIERIRDMHDDGYLGYARIAKAFNVSKSCIARICQYVRRTEPLGLDDMRDVC